jgi:hypothetical protein
LELEKMLQELFKGWWTQIVQHRIQVTIRFQSEMFFASDDLTSFWSTPNLKHYKLHFTVYIFFLRF